MEDPSHLLSRFGDRAVRWRWPIMLAFGLAALVVEILEHTGQGLDRLEPDFFPELFLLGFLLPLVTGLLLRELGRTRERAARHRANAIDAARYRMSRDVHDSIAQQVTYLHLKLDELVVNQASLDDARSHRQLVQLRDVAGEAYDQIYDMLALLRAPAAADLCEILRSHADRVGRRAHLAVDMTYDGEPQQLPPDLRQQLLFIYSEILSNVEKHAEASRVKIRVGWQRRDLVVDVEDDGLGFEAGDPDSGDHYGLAIMRERVNDLGGVLRIDSQPGVGTKVSVSLPLQPRRDEFPLLPHSPAGAGA